ncbi:hypothetical protein Tco_1329272 [Tanacetum coccineum]
MQGTSLSKQERECKLYDEFDKFAYIKGETPHQYYLRFAQLINDMNIYKMTLQQVQVNTKFLNSLPPEWIKFIMDVKLARDLHTTNYDQLHMAHQLYTLAPVINPYEATHHSQYQNQINPQYYNPVNQLPTLSPPLSYPPPLVVQQPHPELHQPESNLDVPTFQQWDDPLDCINKAMTFLTVVASRYPLTNNQIRTSSNPRNQATIHDGTTRNNASGQGKSKDLDAYDSDCDDVSSAKSILMANLSSCDSDLLFETPSGEAQTMSGFNWDDVWKLETSSGLAVKFEALRNPSLATASGK